jgi:hypothetical protein
MVDIVHGGVMTELPLRGVTFTRPLSGPGSFTGVLDLGDPRLSALDPITCTVPGRTAVYVDRDGTLVWSGILWLRTYDSTSRALTLQASEFESYFARRLVTATYSPTAVDQFTVAQALITTAQAVAGGSVGVIVLATTCGVPISHTWNGYELKTVQTALKDIGTVAGGFDWSFDPSYVAGVPTTTFSTFYPAKGTPNATNGVLFEMPGNVVSYTLPEDATTLDVTSYYSGSGTAAAQLETSITDAPLVGVYPLLESVTSDSSILDLPTLVKAAQAENAAAAYPTSLLTLVVRADQDPVLGAYGTGDQIRVRITDPRWPAPAAGGAGLEMLARITSLSITAPDGATTEAVTITADVSVGLPGVPFMLQTQET